MYELGMVADTELPVTVVPGAVKVVAEVTSPKLFPNMSNASAEKACEAPAAITAETGLIVM